MNTKINFCSQCIHEDVCMYKDELLKKQQEVDAVMEESDMKLFKRPHVECMKHQQE